MSGPRCLPSTASPRFRGKGRSRVRSREVFRIDPARRLFAHDRSRFHVPGQELGAHPRTPPNRLKWGTLASLRQNTSCRLLQRDSTTREHNLERPILARIGGRVLPPAPLRHPRFPCEPFEHARHAIALASSSGGGQRATPHQTALFPETVQARPGRKTPKVIALPRTSCEGAQGNPLTVAPRMVETMAMCVCGPTNHERRARNWFPPPGSSSTLWSQARLRQGRMETPSLSRTRQDSRPDALREEEHRRGNQDAFHPSGNPARDDSACHVGRPQFAPRHAAPLRGGFAIEEARLCYRLVVVMTPASDEASARNGSMRQGSELALLYSSTHRSAPEGFCDRYPLAV